MAVRVMTYVGLLHQDLIRKLGLKTGDPLPLVLPIVLYNRHSRWKSPTNVAALIPEEFFVHRRRHTRGLRRRPRHQLGRVTSGQEHQARN